MGNSSFLHLWGWGGNRLPCKKKGVSFGGGGNGGGDGGWGVVYWSGANRIEPFITLIKTTFKNHF